MSKMRMLVQGLSESEGQQIITQVLEARAKRGEFLVAMKQRQQQGWHVAQHCALILKENFGVKRVVLFGSMLDYESMSWHSDIYLAVERLAASDFWKAGAALKKGHDFSIDLVEIELAKPHIIKANAQGVELGIILRLENGFYKNWHNWIKMSRRTNSFYNKCSLKKLDLIRMQSLVL